MRAVRAVKAICVKCARIAAGMLDRKKTKPRLSIELRPEDEALVRRAHADAVLNGLTLRQWLLEAMRHRLQEQGTERRLSAR
jgi:hypothetical protein